MGNLNRRRAISAARAAVGDDRGFLSRAAPPRFTAARRQSAARFYKTVLHCFPGLEASDSRLGSHLFT
jgi:hypothetical protein